MKRRRWLTLGAAVAIVIAFVGYKLWQTGAAPGYWHVTETTPQIADEAEAYERWLPGEVSRVRAADATWPLVIEAAHVNRWLAARLGMWAANQRVELPPWLHRPMVAVQPGRLIVAWQVADEADAQVISGAFEPLAPDATGVVGLGLSDVYVGRMRLSPDTAADYIAGLDGNAPEQIAAWRDRLAGLALRWTLPDGRTVEVVGMELTDGVATLRCRTRPPDGGR